MSDYLKRKNTQTLTISPLSPSISTLRALRREAEVHQQIKEALCPWAAFWALCTESNQAVFALHSKLSFLKQVFRQMFSWRRACWRPYSKWQSETLNVITGSKDENKCRKEKNRPWLKCELVWGWREGRCWNELEERLGWSCRRLEGRVYWLQV